VIEFESLRAEHLPLLREWLGREHVSRWWRTGEESVTHAEEALAGLDATDYYLIVVDGLPVGMIETYRVDDHPDWATLVGERGTGAAGLDLLIGEEDAVGRGLGPRVLEAFTRDVVFREPDITAVVATVEEANRRSWRAFEKAGFRHVRDVEEDGLPHRLMRLEHRYAQ
jgi:RimJ/RimL family protein N-acetyltransferase